MGKSRELSYGMPPSSFSTLHERTKGEGTFLVSSYHVSHQRSTSLLRYKPARWNNLPLSEGLLSLPFFYCVRRVFFPKTEDSDLSIITKISVPCLQPGGKFVAMRRRLACPVFLPFFPPGYKLSSFLSIPPSLLLPS